MKAISLWQPWASAIAVGLKRFETRSWPTRYRGPLLIHAAKRWTGAERAFRGTAIERLRGMPEIGDDLRRSFLGYSSVLGSIVAVANLTDCMPICYHHNASELEQLFGDYTVGRWAWHLSEVRRIEDPVPCVGAQGLWTPSCEVVMRIGSAAFGELKS